MSNNFNFLADLISGSLKKHNLEQKARERSALSVRSEIVGPRISKATKAEQIRDGILFVGCRTATWANELTFLKTDIMGKLNKRLGGQYVKDIRFSTRSPKQLVQTPDEVEERDQIPEKEFEGIQIPPEDLQKIEAVSLEAESEELAARIRKTLITSRKLDQWKIDHGWKKCDSCGSLIEEGDTVCPWCKK
jgi:predicted nucleic acid-binding Zn ribbon protein